MQKGDSLGIASALAVSAYAALVCLYYSFNNALFSTSHFK